jgi:hypothetical protein
MTAVELASCHAPEHPAFPTPVEGYMVSFVAFYERGFGTPSHRFLRLLLQYYGIELPNLTPSGVLHIATFMTLCDAYLGVDPEFNLWNYFFHAQLQQGSEAKVVALGGVDIFITSGHGVDPYFLLLTSGPPDEWQKVWFFLRNNTEAPLPMFTGSHPIPQPNWGYRMAQRDLHRL